MIQFLGIHLKNEKHLFQIYFRGQPVAKLSQPVPQCLLIEFDNKKHLALSFCRIQEFYESNNPKLKGREFSFYEFIKEQMADDGKIKYFNHWDGYNFNDKVYRQWLPWDRTDHERAMIAFMESKLDMDQPFYVIGSRGGDKGTIKHEIAHALYYLDLAYKSNAQALIGRFSFEYPYEYRKFKAELFAMGYAEEVIADEMQAYLSTSNLYDLRKFGVDQPILIERFRHNFRSYLK